MSSMRSPIYPLLIKLFYFTGGNNYQTWLLCFQILFGAFGIFVFCRFIHDFFKMEYWQTFILVLLIATPYIFSGKIANQVMTEAIAYPMFLICIRYLIESVFDKRIRPFIIYMICCIPLILTRGQFLFLYVVSVLVIGYFIIFQKNKRKKIGRVILVFISCIVLTGLLERTYAYFLFKKFDKVSLTGVQLSAAAFYLSTPDDVKIFRDSTQIKFFKDVQEITHHKNNWNKIADVSKTPGNSGLGYYQAVYNKIIWKAVFPEAIKYIPQEDVSSDLKSWIFVDKLAKTVSIKLIRQHRYEFLLLVTKNVFYGLGYKHCFPLFFLVFIASFIFAIKYKNDFGILFLLMLGIGLSNVLLISVVEPTAEYRYLIYNDALYITLIIIAINCWLKYMVNKTIPLNQPPAVKK